jgi:hypothetical protein
MDFLQPVHLYRAAELLTAPSNVSCNGGGGNNGAINLSVAGGTQQQSLSLQQSNTKF